LKRKKMSGRGRGDKKQCRLERLTIEALVAAGPRKSSEEYRSGLFEPCEDIAGYRILDRGFLFWICDGTSNSHELPAWKDQLGFNSRILAQDLGWEFSCLAGRALLQRKGYQKSDLVKRLFEGIAKKWRERLIAYLDEVERHGKLERLLSRMPQMGHGAYRMQWSSTFLGGVYDERAQTLNVMNIGDSGIVVIADRPRMVGAKDGPGILLATIRQASPLDVDVSSVPVEDAGWEHFRGVRGFVAASDGVAKDLRMFLSQTGDTVPTQLTVDRIYRQMNLQSRLTYDDRAIIIGRLTEGESRGGKSGRRRRRGKGFP
jgi:hypothetical protein